MAESNIMNVNANENEKQVITTRDNIIDVINSMDIYLNRYGQYCYQQDNIEMDIDIDVLVTRIIDVRQRNRHDYIGRETIKHILIEYKRSEKDKKYVEFVNSIRFDSTKTNKIDIICRSIAGPNHNTLYPVLLNHMGYSIKRRMYNLPVDYPILINFSGKESVGKSFFIRSIYKSIIPEGYYEEVKDSGKTLNNIEKNGYLFRSRLFLYLGEMTSMNELGIENLKDIIDSADVSSRMYHSNSESYTAQNKSQIIGSSNKHLKDILQRDDFVRKYCNIQYDDCPMDERQNIRWKMINEFDWIEWIKSINENDESPLSKCYPEFLKWVKADMYRPTDSELWLNGFMVKNKGETIMFKSILDEYYDCNINPKLGRDNFIKLLNKFDCIKIKKERGSYYTIPNNIKPIENSDVVYKSEYTREESKSKMLKDFFKKKGNNQNE